MYESKLRELCHQKGWDSPQYTIKIGPDSNKRFTATVTVTTDDIPFHATAFLCRTMQEAQSKAAMLAFDYFCRSPNLPPSPAAPASSSPSAAGLPAASTSLDYTKLPIEVPSGVKDDPKLKGTAGLVPVDLPPGSEIMKALEVSSSFLQSLVIGNVKESVPKANCATPEAQEEEHTNGNTKKSSPKPPPTTRTNTEVSTVQGLELVPQRKRQRLDVEAPAEASVRITSLPPKIVVYPRARNVPFPEGATEMPFSNEKWVALKM